MAVHQGSNRYARDHGLATLAAVLSRTDLDRVAREMVKAYAHDIASYARLAPKILWGRKYDQARAHLQLFYELAASRRDIVDADLDLARRSARADMHDGISLDDLLHAYRIAGVVCWREITPNALAEDHFAAAAAGELYVRFAENISSAATGAYHDEMERLGLREDRLHRALFDGLIGRSVSERELAELADELRVALRPAYRPFAAAWTEGSQRDLARLLSDRGLFALVDGERVAGLALDEAAADALARSGATFAIAGGTERARLAAALVDLHALVDVGQRAGRTGRIDEDEFLIERCVVRSPWLGAALQRLVLAPIQEHDAKNASELLATLEACVASGLSRKAAAERLNVHPNTLDYRLDQIRQLTGLTPSAPRDLVLVTLALAERELARTSTVASHRAGR